ncbi:MAG: OB-fold nucleic acid binding domain-containing protein [Candidatus Nanoarchaeia archaeon]
MVDELSVPVVEEKEKKILRRAPAIPVQISKLNSSMGRVAVLGTIISKNANIGSIVIDDGSASVLVLLNDPADIEKLKEGQTVRVLGKVWGSGDEIELQAELVQDFSKIDKELYNKVFFSQ